jgi:hypothetical protein
LCTVTHEVHVVEDDPQGPDGALQDGRVHDVERDAFLFQQPPGVECFLTAGG